MSDVLQKRRELFARLLKKEGLGDRRDRIAPRARASDPCPASFAQQRLWFLDQLDPGNHVYNIPAALRFEGVLNAHALEQALNDVAARHESLRTTFAAADGRPVQVVAPSLSLSLPVVDLSEFAPEQRPALSHRLMREEGQRPFDLARGPLLRGTLLRLDEREHVLLLTMHHAVSDGWSLGVFLRELAANYEARLSGRAASLPALPIQYGDFAAWQREWLRGEALESQLAFWREKLAGAPPTLELPTDHRRPAAQTFRGARRSVEFPDGLTAALKEFCRREGVTLFMTLLAAFDALLHRYTGRDDLPVGSPVANRHRVEVEGLIGFFANTLVLRADLSGDPTFRQLLGRVRDLTLEAQAHQDVPFEKLVEELRPERDLSHTPLFQVMFALQSSPPQVEWPGLSVSPLSEDTGTARLDLMLYVEESPGGLGGWFEYNADLFDEATITRLAGHFRILIKGALADPDRRLSSLPLLTSVEERQLLIEWNDTRRDYAPGAATIHELFEEQAAAKPEAVAVVHGGAKLTYGELNARANRLARHLRRLGVGAETLVGVMAERTPEMVVALLGILKAGGAYVPLDAQYPRERIAFILEDARVGALLTTRHLSERLPPVGSDASKAEVVLLDEESETIDAESGENLEAVSASRNLAYVIYTSGSTGRPKGVSIEHASAAAFLRWARETFTERELAGVLASTSICFDLSVFELFGTLAAGGAVVLAGDALGLGGVSGAAAVTLVNTVPSAMTELVRLGAVPGSVLTVNLAGEPLQNALAQRIYQQPGVTRVLNLYGPSEDTTYSTWTCVPKGSADPVNIGRPVADTRVYILDAWMRPVPVCVKGELYLGGYGLARGYLRRAGLTAEKFVPDPFDSHGGGRLYRTGDEARYLPDGQIDFLGRADFQVKIRGFRIELGEIEAALCNHPAIGEAVVVAREDAPGDKRLVAYLVPERGAGATPGELRSYLRERLPDYMIPSAFVLLEALPLTPNGKIERRALPAPGQESSPAAGGSFEPAETEVEETLAGIWTGVLGVERVGRHDNFFDLGGHSLLATQVMARVLEVCGAQIPLRALFESPTIAGLAHAVEEARSRHRPTPPTEMKRVERDEELPLSFAQQRLWFVEQFEPGGAAYNVPAAFGLRGRLLTGALAQALGEVVRRHEVLRTTYAAAGGRARQVIRERVAVEVPAVDLRGVSEERREAAVRRLIGEESRRPFDLERGPLLRARLLRLAEEEHVLLFTMHHIISDGWSVGVLAREVAALYKAFSEGQQSPLEELKIQYADYAVWQREWLSGEVLEEQLAYWKGRLAGAPPVLELPTDKPRPPVQSFRGATEYFTLPGCLSQDINALARREGATPFMTLMAAWQLLLSRYSGQAEVVVGTPIANRHHAEVEGLIGFFANSVAVRTRVEEGGTFRELLGQVREAALGAYAHQDVPFEMVVEELQPERSLSHSPVFQVDFTMQNAPLPAVEMAGLRLTQWPVENGTAKYDLMLNLTESDGQLHGFVEYSTDLFERESIGRLVEHFGRVLAGVVADAGRPLSELSLLTEGERRRVLHEWNATEAEFPRERCVHELFAEQAARAPEAIAVTFGEQELTYGELNERANRLGNYLRGLGVGPETPVGLCVERSPEMVVGMLGILKAGGAYVPLDPKYPMERLAFMLEDSAVPVLLTQEALLDALPANWIQVVCLDAEWDEIEKAGAETPRNDTTAEGLAYLMYTSGSTGQPKGAGITHRAVVRLVRQTRYADFGPDEVFLQLAPISFDASTFEVWGSLLNLGRLVLMPPDAPTLEQLGAALRRHGVTTLWLTAGLFHLMVDEQLESLLGLRQLLAGGDVLSPQHVKRVLDAPGAPTLINGYGPTENTTFTCCHPMSPGDSFGASVPVGRPIGNTQIYVLDREMRPVPLGVAGELYAAGDGLARGYHKRPALTAERFVPHPFSAEPGARLYATRDLVRYLPGGEIEFLGRLDGQVKVRGFRIELGEVESVLAGHGAVREVVVEAREEVKGGKRLVAYVTRAPGAEPTADELRRYSREKLPEYMIPSAFVVLERLPLTANGKVDRRALPEPDSLRPELADAYVPPETPIEEQLSHIWSEVLGVERVGRHDNFFDLGGHSLLATQVMARVLEVCGAQIPLRALFESPTIAGLAHAVEASASRPASPPEEIGRAARGEELPLSFAQQRLWFVEQFEPGGAAYNVPAAFGLRGRLRVGALAQALGEVVRRHEVLRTTYAAAGGRARQVIRERVAVEVPAVDLRGVSDEVREAAVQRLIGEESRRPFDLERGPLLRARLLRVGEEEHVLLFTMHHIVCDAWSLGVLAREVASLYGALATGGQSPLAELEIQYADFAVWQRRRFGDGALEEHLAYWKRRLRGSERLRLPSDRATAAGRGDSDVGGAETGVERFTLERGLSEELNALSRAEGVTLFMTLLAGFKALLHRHTGQGEIVLGTNVANRQTPRAEGLIGFFVNMLVLRTDLSGDPTFRELLGRVRETTLGAYEHGEVPYERLVQELRGEAGAGAEFRAVFSLQNAPGGEMRLPGLALTPVEVGSDAAGKYDIVLNTWEAGGRVQGWLQYDAGLFEVATVRRLVRRYERLLGAASAEPGARLSELGVLGADEGELFGRTTRIDELDASFSL